MTEKILYDWKELDIPDTEVHAVYAKMTGKIDGYIVRDRSLGVYKLWYNQALLGEFISVEAAKTFMNDITGKTTLQ